MSERALVTAAALFLVTTFVTLLFVALAPRLGLVDDASDARNRKHHLRAVPLVGGVALALALAAWVLHAGPDAVGGQVLHGVAFAPRAVLSAAGLAFLTGLIDDVLPKGLGPLPKFAGQLAAAVALASGLELDGNEASTAAAALAVLTALVAQNAANTFDNADGALTSVAAAGFACAAPLGVPFVGAVLAFLPWCLVRVRGAATPRAWLGDSGSHLLGILLVTTPIAWAALLLPLLDLARVVVVRVRAGDPIWVGDRRHLAHELQARGLGPARVVLVLVLLTVPLLTAVAAWMN